MRVMKNVNITNDRNVQTLQNEKEKENKTGPLKWLTNTQMPTLKDFSLATFVNFSLNTNVCLTATYEYEVYTQFILSETQSSNNNIHVNS